MANRQDITAEIDSLNDIALLVRTYEEVAANIIRRIRNSVIAKREFTSELSTLFHELANTHRQEILLLMKEKGKKDMTKMSMIPHNGKTACLFFISEYWPLREYRGRHLRALERLYQNAYK